jgi:hypothetical protein
MLRRVALERADVSEEPSASFISVTRIGELGTTLAATSNRRTVDPTAGVDDMKKLQFWTLPGLELRLHDRPARNQSLYRLSYNGSAYIHTYISISNDGGGACSSVVVQVLSYNPEGRRSETR